MTTCLTFHNRNCYGGKGEFILMLSKGLPQNISFFLLMAVNLHSLPFVDNLEEKLELTAPWVTALVYNLKCLLTTFVACNIVV